MWVNHMSNDIQRGLIMGSVGIMAQDKKNSRSSPLGNGVVVWVWVTKGLVKSIGYRMKRKKSNTLKP